MKDIYLLQFKPEFGGKVLAAADDFDRASMEMSHFTAITQAKLEVNNLNLFEEGD